MKTTGIYITDPLYVRDYWKKISNKKFLKKLVLQKFDGKITKLDTFTQPNGIVGSQKLKKLYVSDMMPINLCL